MSRVRQEISPPLLPPSPFLIASCRRSARCNEERLTAEVVRREEISERLSRGREEHQLGRVCPPPATHLYLSPFASVTRHTPLPSRTVRPAAAPWLTAPRCTNSLHEPACAKGYSPSSSSRLRNKTNETFTCTHAQTANSHQVSVHMSSPEPRAAARAFPQSSHSVACRSRARGGRPAAYRCACYTAAAPPPRTGAATPRGSTWPTTCPPRFRVSGFGFRV